MRITGLVAMKWAAALKVSPLSGIKIQALILTWTIKNEIKNNPVKPITNFLPIDELRKPFLLITNLN
jgi:hypothetical protein